MVKNIRLWKSNYEEAEQFKEIQDLEKKYSNYTHVKVDGDILNINDEQKGKKLHEINYSDTDILIVEMPKKDDYVFQPKAGTGNSDEQLHEDFDDPLNNVPESSFSLQALEKL